ncbi:motile sperm domain-containing protein 2-like [Aricia agestis]|uniref:motile sperm domain-containing protein 2-like n=1 Tax=Aricia agestis TaxID=91739 RepID=UPI001C2015ED|nr:motile sperm domain-containing protein 2-like [Aricia agestis]
MTTADLLNLFESKLKEKPDHDFHPLDLERLKDERYLTRVMKHSENDPKQATEMLWDIFTWRKTQGANEINEGNIKMEYVTEGAFFPHGRDIDGCLLLIMKSKKHIKGQKNIDEIKKIIIYWFDRIEREENGKKVSLFFDLEGCGLSNMDMELVNFIISLFKSYYPFFLNYIVIYQMPWVLSAPFKIIKSLLPAKAVEKMKFVNKDTLKDIVPPEQALTCWGGQDDYVFQFVPENKAQTEHTPKKVTFAEQPNTQHSPGEMLQINPSSLIIFNVVNDEITGQFTIKNMDEGPISFKIRTTSPEKFRVRPSSGVLTGGSSQTIVIVVQPEFQMRNVSKDMFLVMSVQIPKTDLSANELREVWQKSSGSKVDEYRLKCQFPIKEIQKNGKVNEDLSIDKPDSIVNALNNLQINYEMLHRQVNSLKILQLIILLLTAISVVLGFMLFQNKDPEEYCDRI